MIGDLARFDHVGPGRYTGAFDASWNQGPGTYGGLLAAAMGSALEDHVPGRSLRALSMHLCAPAEPGPLEINVSVERKGAAVSFASARLEREGRAVVIATSTLASARAGDADFDHAVPPCIPAPEACSSFGRAPGVPVFTEHFDFRFAEGVPFTGQAHPRTAGWLGLLEPEPLTTPVALALLDCWPLAILPTFPSPRPAASVAIHFQLFPPLEASAGPWFQSLVTTDVLRQGYSDQINTLWDADGRLVGRAHQLVAVIR